jgi:tRNA threonylcarbamoyladenosine biosynthesis protein TsaB
LTLQGAPEDFKNHLLQITNYKYPMLLLALDTSGKNGSLALAQIAVGAREASVIESVPIAGGTFSAQLVPQISALLAKHEYTKSDLDGFVVVSGPGSFTGLRVGLAAIKALAEGLQKPIAAVSLLEAVAQAATSTGRILAALDAGRSEIYVGDYDVSGHRYSQAILHRERVLTRAEFLAEAERRKLVTPDATLAENLQAARIQCEQIAYPTSQLIATLGWQRIQGGQTTRPEDLEANYIRRSDAEIFSQPKP